ncbi:MAG: hypothetical protein JXR37_18235 [Kiritimatiellae bacterium]|nr:hypothetical protein [Kiritimatiellia bacterium]
MTRVTCAVGIGVLVGCLAAHARAAAGGPTLYLPLDEGRVLAVPAGAEVSPRGKPLFQEGRRGTGLMVDAKGRSVSQLTVTGAALADPAQGTAAFWLNPQADYGAGRHSLLNLLSAGNPDEGLFIFVEKGNLYLQSRAGGKWPGVHFGFDWIKQPPWKTGTWYHLAVSWGLQAPTVFYVNGKKAWSSTTALGFSGAEAPIDRIVVGSNSAGKEQADAVLDEVFVYGAVLDEALVKRVMAGEQAAGPVPAAAKPEPAPGPATFEAELPPGVKAVWDMEKAARVTTPTRERICINGLWRWQPGKADDDVVPGAGWGFFKVPGCWPGITSYNMKDCQTLVRHPAWQAKKINGVRAAWHQREIAIPANWAGRRISVRADYLNSYADLFVDGKKAGSMRFPGGEVDITALARPGTKQVLSALVVAMPLKGVIASYNDTNSSRDVKGSVARRGFCGDLFLLGEPGGPRVTDVRVITSVRKGEITFEAVPADLAAGPAYALRAVILEQGREIKTFDGAPFRAADLQEGRTSFTAKWRPEKLWDTHTPGHTYEARLELLDARGQPLDVCLPARFGFREFWIDGRDFYLNGSRIFLSSVPFDNAQLGAAWASYEGAKESMRRLMRFGINMVYSHHYDCLPGSHLGCAEILRAADDVGMLFSFSLPHFGHYDWQADDADAANGYARHAAFYVRAAQNHPSVVFYSMSHNATGDGNDMNPDLMGCPYTVSGSWSLNNRKKAARAEAIARRLDPSRVVYHHSSGSFGVMHTSNFYPNWAPVQELCDWFEHWSVNGVKPVFTCEYGAPFAWDWAMYRGWYKDKRTFGSARVPWEFCLAEWNAQFFGDRAYRISEKEKKNLRWEADKFRAGRTWQRWDYPHELGSRDFEEREPVFAAYLSENWRAFRTWGLSANSPWEHGILFKPREGLSRKTEQKLETDWANLQRPGFSADYLKDRYERMDLAYEREDWVPTEGAKALIRNNMPLLAYIGGKRPAFTSKAHIFTPGETVAKQLIVINNSRRSVGCECAWSFALPQPVTGSQRVSVETGDQQRIPLSLALPATLAPGRYVLSAKMVFDSGSAQEDEFVVHVIERPGRPAVRARVALFDPKGETGRLLAGMGVKADAVDAGADLGGYELLVIGKGALTTGGAAPDIRRVREGLKVLVFEQTPDVLEKRFGFRIAEYGLRQVFPRVPDHPALVGLAPEHLRDWRGAATLQPPRLPANVDRDQNYGRAYRWCGIAVPRVWRCGNRGNLASVLIEKPACGDFMPVVDGGFGLQYSPLLEYREGNGLVVLCQMDVTGRTEADPAAERLAGNLLAYVAAWQPAPRRRAVYAGEPAGLKHLQAAGIHADPLNGGQLSGDQLLVLGPGAGKALAGKTAALGSWLKGGGRVVGVGLTQADAAALPFKVSMKQGEHIAASFEAAPAGSPLAGIGPADIHNRDPRKVPLVTNGAEPVGNGVLAVGNGGNAVFCQLAPWTFDTGKQNQKRTFRRTSCTLARLLGNFGVDAQTPLLERFAGPVKEPKAEQRWATGFYLDQPEEWDDPYRFFRW